MTGRLVKRVWSILLSLGTDSMQSTQKPHPKSLYNTTYRMRFRVKTLRAVRELSASVGAAAANRESQLREPLGESNRGKRTLPVPY